MGITTYLESIKRDANLTRTCDKTIQKYLPDHELHAIGVIDRLRGTNTIRLINFTDKPLQVLRPSGFIEIVHPTVCTDSDYKSKFIILDNIASREDVSLADTHLNVSEVLSDAIKNKSSGWLVTILDSADIYNSPRGVAVMSYMITVASNNVKLTSNKCFDVFAESEHGPFAAGTRYVLHCGKLYADKMFLATLSGVIEIIPRRDQEAYNVLDVYRTDGSGKEERIKTYNVDEIINNPQENIGLFSTELAAKLYMETITEALEVKETLLDTICKLKMDKIRIVDERTKLKEEHDRAILKLGDEKRLLNSALSLAKAKVTTSFWTKLFTIGTSLLAFIGTVLTFILKYNPKET